jgi:hypothetical protein
MQALCPVDPWDVWEDKNYEERVKEIPPSVIKKFRTKHSGLSPNLINSDERLLPWR